jgi:peptide/nickel transport system substrate-binding protein
MNIKRFGRAAAALLLPALAAPLAAALVVRGGNLFDPPGMDPARVWDETSSFYVVNIFDTLVRLDPRTLTIQPSLAVAWEASPDGRTWTFRLRQGVRFHDGTALDADAVVFSFWRQMDPANPRRLDDFPLFAEIFSHLQAVRKLDSRRVQFVLSAPYFPFLASLTADCASIVSPAAVRRLGAEFTRHPVGSGPFMLESWQPGKRLVLKANRGYWRGRPAIDQFVETIEPRTELLSKSFQEGTLDILSSYSISQMASFRKLDWVRVTSEPLFSVTYIVFNTARPLLRSQAVRQALCHAWDPRALKLIFQDHVLPTHSLLPPGLTGRSAAAATAPERDFSLAKAKALLRREGVPAAAQLEMVLQRDEGLLFQVLSMYAKNLKQAGVQLKLTRLAPEEYVRRVAAGDYDLAYSAWIADYPDPDSMLFPLLSDKLQQQGFATAANAGNRRGLLERLRDARRQGDLARRQAAYAAIDRAFVQDGLILPLFQSKRVILSHGRLGPIPANPMGRLLLFDLKAP